MNKTLNNNQITLDNTTNLVYNTSMTNNNTNNNTTFLKGTQTMTNKAHDVRVIKHIDGSYNTFANFPTVQEAVAYMRNWNANAMDSWYIIDANGNRLRMNQQNKLEVFHSLIG
jgi:hypothetical protein